MGLEEAFSPLRHGIFTAQDFFADRVDERQAFRDAVAAVGQRLSVTDIVADLAAPRSNVLVFYGTGGIGKSRLSKELENIARTSGSRSACVRLDFANGGLRDPEEVLLRLRIGLADQGWAFPAFDTLLAIYWSHQHPHLSLSDYLRPRSWSQRIDLAEIVQNSVEDLIVDVADKVTFGLVGLGRRLATISFLAIQERARNSHLARDCPRFKDALEASPEELLPFLSYFLAWDLHQTQFADLNRAETPVVPVVFLDTWEDVQSDSTARGSLEDFCALMVSHVPNGLFVFTGRDRLGWTESDAGMRLQRSGSNAWPGLVATAVSEPRQHLLGVLPDSDSDEYLRRAVQVDGKAAIPDDLRSIIVRTSRGHPYHLDLAVDVFTDIHRRGESPTNDLFSQPFPELVSRIVRNLDTGSRDLLFAASVLGSFSTQSLRYLVPSASNSAIDHFVSRHLVRSTHDEWLPYALHDNVRDAVYGATSLSGGAWQPDVWQETSQRAVTWLLQSVPTEVTTNTDASRLSQATILIARLSAEGDLLPEFVRLIGMLRELGLWLTLDAIETVFESKQGRDPTGDLRACIRLIRRSTQMTRRDVVETAKSIVASSQQESIRFLAAQVGLAAAMDCGDLSAGRAFLLTQDENPGVRSDLAWRESDFRVMALALACQAPEGTLEQICQEDRLGHLAIAEGRFDDALQRFDVGRKLAKKIDSPLWTGRTSRHAAMAATLGRKGDSARRVADAAQHNPMLNDFIGHQQCLALTAVHRAADGNLPEAVEGFRAARHALITDEAWSDLGLVIMFEVLAALRYGLALSEESRSLLDEHRVWQVMAWRREIIAVWLGHPSPVPSIQWSREPLDIYSSWRAVITK